MTERWNLLIPMLLSLALVTACASPELQEKPAEEFAAEGLHEVKGTGFASAYVLPTAQLPSYGQVNFAQMNSAEVEVTSTTVTGTTRRDWQMTAEREAKLAEAWSSATTHAFSDYPREDAESGALQVEAWLTRVSPGRSTNTSSATVGSSSSINRDVVSVSAEFRIYDAASQRLLAVVRDSQNIASLQWTRAGGADMANLFNSWAALLHTRISGR